MADVNGGALSFTSVMDNRQMNAAIEETLRRVQGFSNAVVGSGDAMDKTTQEIVESINIQRQVIQKLENTVSELNAKINEVQPGAAQDMLIEQANAARAELEEEKKGMIALITELNNLQRANDMAASSVEGIRDSLVKIADACAIQEDALSQLNLEYENVTKQMGTAFKAGNDNNIVPCVTALKQSRVKSQPANPCWANCANNQTHWMMKQAGWNMHERRRKTLRKPMFRCVNKSVP